MKISKQAIDFAETVRDLECRHKDLLSASWRAINAFESLASKVKISTNDEFLQSAREEIKSSMMELSVLAVKEVEQ